MAQNLRGYTEYQVLKNVSNPVMFLGLPFTLAIIFIAVIMIASFTAMFMNNFGVGIVLNIAVPAGIAFGGITAVRTFYKKFGIKGFAMTQRDKKLGNKVSADKSVQQILAKK